MRKRVGAVLVAAIAACLWLAWPGDEERTERRERATQENEVPVERLAFEKSEAGTKTSDVDPTVAPVRSFWDRVAKQHTRPIHFWINARDLETGKRIPNFTLTAQRGSLEDLGDGDWIGHPLPGESNVSFVVRAPGYLDRHLWALSGFARLDREKGIDTVIKTDLAPDRKAWVTIRARYEDGTPYDGPLYGSGMNEKRMPFQFPLRRNISGEYIGDLPVGTWKMIWFTSELGPNKQNVLDVAPGEHIELDFTFKRGADLTVDFGKAKHYRLTRSGVSSLRTAPKPIGRQRFRDVAPGQYEFRIGSRTLAVNVKAGDRYEFDFERDAKQGDSRMVNGLVRFAK